MNPKPAKAVRKQINHVDTLKTIVGSPEFAKNREQMDELGWAVAHTALSLAELETSPSGYRSPEANRLHVVATIDRYVSAQQVTREGNLLPGERDGVKKDLIAFNHALSALINNDPQATPTEVLAFLDGLYGQLHSRDPRADRKQAHQDFKESLTGMVSELAGEQLFGYLGYDVEDDISIEDDRRGIDRYVAMDGGWYGVDFKTSVESAAKARALHPDNFILCAGVAYGEFHSGFQLGNDVLARHAPAFERQLAQEWARYHRHHGNL